MPLNREQNKFMVDKIKIQIAYAFPDHHYLKSFSVDEGTMVQTAILQSGNTIFTHVGMYCIRKIYRSSPFR